ncbi:MAG: IS1380 family transposase [Terriglobales bacterium]
MTTECSGSEFDFHPLGSRRVTAAFNGGTITSDGGALLLRELEARTGLLADLAQCFDDHRDPELIEHTVEELVKQRVFALALGYEDLNDHDMLRSDPLLAAAVGKRDPLGQERVNPGDRGKALAGKSTLNRLELTPVGARRESRYKKIVARHADLESWFVEMFLQLASQVPDEIVLDLDATDDPLHGHQLGRFFHGYYKHYCYLPLYVFCGEHLLCAKLRPADIDAAAGSVKVVERIVAQIRRQWPQVRIILRADSGFCRENLMRWCEANGVDYLFGLAKNARLQRIIGQPMQEARLEFEATGEPCRKFADFCYQTRKSWSRPRRVVGKAEHLAKGANPRFVVTSLASEECDARALYEDRYCARGEMENRIKEQQLCLFADRTSCHSMRANQLRLWLSSAAYVLLQALRERGLAKTEMARARCDTMRLKLLKIGAVVRVTVRRVWVSLSGSYPYQELFRQVLDNLRQWKERPPPAPA